MNRLELESILKKARLPEISAESLEIFPRRIAARLKRNEPSRAARKFFPHLAWTFGLAACVVVAFAIGFWTDRMATRQIPVVDSLASLKLIRETLAVFPNQVRAIVKDEHGLHLVLSDKPDVPDSTPIYVQISDGKQSSSLVTFSGQEVQIAGQQVTVLSQVDGGIILEGNKFFWSDGKLFYAERNLKIEAKRIGLNSL